MHRFLLTILTAASICGPLAAHAAMMPDPGRAGAGVPAQIDRLAGQVMALNTKVQMLQQQNMGAQQALFAHTDGG